MCLESGERRRDGLAFATGIGLAQRQERVHGVVEFVGTGGSFRREQRHALFDLAEVAERTRELDGLAPAAGREALGQRLSVQRHREIGVPGRVERGPRS